MAVDPLKTIAELVPGDMVDLQGDRFADPKNNYPPFEFEYSTVMEIDRETPTCIAIYFDGFACGFPPDHQVKFAGHDEGFES